MKQSSRIEPITATQAQRILDRDLGRCVVCGDAVTGRRRSRWDVWMRLARPSARQVDDPRVVQDSNLFTICGYAGSKCTGDVREYPIAARARGLVLWRGQSPWLVPIHVWAGAKSGHLLDEDTTAYLLDDDGAREMVTTRKRHARDAAEFLGIAA